MFIVFARCKLVTGDLMKYIICLYTSHELKPSTCYQYYNTTNSQLRWESSTSFRLIVGYTQEQHYLERNDSFEKLMTENNDSDVSGQLRHVLLLSLLFEGT